MVESVWCPSRVLDKFLIVGKKRWEKDPDGCGSEIFCAIELISALFEDWF